DWYACTPDDCSLVDSATGPTYTPADGDVGRTFVVVVTAEDQSDKAFDALAVSRPTAPVAPTTPGAPGQASAVGGDGQATVSFVAPSPTGGSPVTGYVVTASPGGLSASGSVSPITVTGLVDGTSYTFAVRAVNIAGTGPASAASGPVTPV